MLEDAIPNWRDFIATIDMAVIRPSQNTLYSIIICIFAQSRDLIQHPKEYLEDLLS